MHIGPVVPIALSSKDLLPWYALFITLVAVLSAQVAILMKIEHEFHKFLLGRSKRGLWANKRLATLAWNDAIRDYCDANNLEIVLHKRISYPTTLADALNQYV